MTDALTPAQLLESAIVHSTEASARILGYVDKHGKGRSDIVRELIRSGAIRVVDPSQPVARWVVSSNEIRRYVEAGARTGADVVPLRGVS